MKLCECIGCLYSQYLKKFILKHQFHQIIHCHCLCQKPRTSFEQCWKKPKIKRGSENEGFERRHVSDICLLQVSTTQTESAFYRKEYRVNLFETLFCSHKFP